MVVCFGGGTGDSKGHTHHETRHTWHEIAFEERSADFYLQDGVSKVFINGSNRGNVKVQSITAAGSSAETFFSAPPPGIQWLISTSNAAHKWNNTGRYKYAQLEFEINELVAALGVVAPAVDPFTGEPCKFLVPISNGVLTPAYFQANKWEEWDVRSWNDLTQQSPSVMLSDAPSFTGGVQVTPVGQLPVYMTYNAEAPPEFTPPPPPQLYAPGALNGQRV